MFNPLRDILTRSPASLIGGIESKMPKGAPRLSQSLVNMANILPSILPPSKGSSQPRSPKSISDVAPPITVPKMSTNQYKSLPTISSSSSNQYETIEPTETSGAKRSSSLIFE